MECLPGTGFHGDLEAQPSLVSEATIQCSDFFQRDKFASHKIMIGLNIDEAEHRTLLLRSLATVLTTCKALAHESRMLRPALSNQYNFADIQKVLKSTSVPRITIASRKVPLESSYTTEIWVSCYSHCTQPATMVHRRPYCAPARSRCLPGIQNQMEEVHGVYSTAV